jgi:hypothetical protein
LLKIQAAAPFFGDFHDQINMQAAEHFAGFSLSILVPVMKNLLKNPRYMIAIAIVATVAYLWISSPAKVVVQSDGTIIGFLNYVREKLQGTNFWVDQRNLAQREYEHLQKEPERDREVNVEIEKLISEHRRDMEQIYREHPTSRPSKSAEKAEELRDLADRIESAELQREIEQYRQQRLRELSEIDRFAHGLARIK